MKFTLLGLTQNILSALNADQVNSIGDTPESLQVAECIRTSYMNMQGRYDLPEHNQFFQLDPSDDPTKPVLMFRPQGVNRIEELWYYDSNPNDGSQGIEDQFGAFSHDLNTDLLNNSSGASTVPPGYKEVCLLPVKDFVNMVNSFNQNETDVGTYTLTINENSNQLPMSFTLKFKNNKQPQYYTVLSDLYVLFDSFDNTQDATLQASKTLTYGWVIPMFVMEDNFTPNLDEAQFPMLLQEAKSLAFLEIKQTQHPKAEKEVMRQLSSLQKFKFTAHRPQPIDELPSFGRTGNHYYGTYK